MKYAQCRKPTTGKKHRIECKNWAPGSQPKEFGALVMSEKVRDTMITKSGWITFCYPLLANVKEGCIAHEFKARMSIPANGTLYAKIDKYTCTAPTAAPLLSNLLIDRLLQIASDLQPDFGIIGQGAVQARG